MTAFTAVSSRSSRQRPRRRAPWLSALALCLFAAQAMAAAPVAKLTVVRPVVAGQSVSATLLASDADGNPLTYSIVTPPTVGTLTLDNASTGAFTYSVPYSADPGAARRVTFTFKVNDGTADSVEQTVYLTVLPRGNRVVAAGGNGYGQTNVSGWSDVVAVGSGVYHTVGLKADGTVVAVGYNDYGQTNVSGWSDVVAVAAGGSHTAGLKANATPVASAVTLYIEPGTPATTQNLAALGTDGDGDAVTLVGKSDGAHGTVTDNGDGTLTYTPDSVFEGADSFTYTVSDGITASVPATVTVHASTDWDGDGLPNAWETAHGLDPNDDTGVNGADGDLDGDGLPNDWEFAHSLDPNDDTGVNGADGDPDSDGLPNDWEFAHSLDPKDDTGVNGADGDPDGDGVTNADEYADGTDPLALTTAKPRFSAAAGSYQDRVSVTLESPTAGATLRYTLDGTDPSPTHGTESASGAVVEITASATLKAMAYIAGRDDSAIASAHYEITSGGSDDDGGSGGGGSLELAGLGALLLLGARRRKRGSLRR